MSEIKSLKKDSKDEYEEA